MLLYFNAIAGCILKIVRINFTFPTREHFFFCLFSIPSIGTLVGISFNSTIAVQKNVSYVALLLIFSWPF